MTGPLLSGSSRSRLKLFPCSLKLPPQPQTASNTPNTRTGSSYTCSLPEATQSAPDLTSPTLELEQLSTPPWDWIQPQQPLPPLCPISPISLHSVSLLPVITPNQSLSRSTSTRLERRFQALLEICDTEAGYLRDLRILVHGYLAILDRAPFVSSGDKSIVRRNLDQVLELAERFSRRISLAVGSKLDLWRLPGTSRDEVEVDKLIERLAKAFISESPIFTVYEDLCARHTEAADIIRDFETSPEWITFLQQCRSAEGSPGPSTSSMTSSVITGPSTTSSSSSAAASHQPNQVALQSTLASVFSVTNHSRLRLQDFAIKPVQRITRYPLLLASLLKYMDGDSNPGEVRARDKVYQALGAMKEVASGVDNAKSSREVELKTELIASRMELHHSYRAAFVSLLGQIQLVGSLHVLYHGPVLDPNEAFKIKYHGILLYQTHLVIVKVKRTTVYEPRHWFPIRYFDLVDIPECSGLMPHSFSLKYRRHTFEFGATWEPEKKIWMEKLKSIKDEVEKLRALHLESELPLNDDSIVSSINLDESSPSTPSASVPDSKLSSAAPPYSPDLTMEEGNMLGETDDSAPMAEETPIATSSQPPSAQSRVSQRLSRNVNTLLGRTPEVAQAAIDLKLTEIFSDVLLAARIQGQQEQESIDLNSRQRTLSGPGASSTTASSQKRQGHLPPHHTFSTRASERKLKRMTYMATTPPIFLETSIEPASSMTREAPVATSPVSVRSSSSSLRRAKTGPPKERPPSIHDLWRLNRASTTNSTRSRPIRQQSSDLMLDMQISPEEAVPRRQSADGGSSSDMSGRVNIDEVVRTVFSSPEPSSGHSSATTVHESVEERGTSRVRESSGRTDGTGATSVRRPVENGGLRGTPQEADDDDDDGKADLTLVSSAPADATSFFDVVGQQEQQQHQQWQRQRDEGGPQKAFKSVNKSHSVVPTPPPSWFKIMPRKESRGGGNHTEDASNSSTATGVAAARTSEAVNRPVLSTISTNSSSSSSSSSHHPPLSTATTMSKRNRSTPSAWSLPSFIKPKSSGSKSSFVNLWTASSSHKSYNNNNTPGDPLLCALSNPASAETNRRIRSISNECGKRGSGITGPGSGLRSFLRMTHLRGNDGNVNSNGHGSGGGNSGIGSGEQRHQERQQGNDVEAVNVSRPKSVQNHL